MSKPVLTCPARNFPSTGPYFDPLRYVQTRNNSTRTTPNSPIISVIVLKIIFWISRKLMLRSSLEFVFVRNRVFCSIFDKKCPFSDGNEFNKFSTSIFCEPIRNRDFFRVFDIVRSLRSNRWSALVRKCRSCLEFLIFSKIELGDTSFVLNFRIFDIYFRGDKIEKSIFKFHFCGFFLIRFLKNVSRQEIVFANSIGPNWSRYRIPRSISAEINFASHFSWKSNGNLWVHIAFTDPRWWSEGPEFSIFSRYICIY